MLVKVTAFSVGFVNAFLEFASFKAFIATFPGGKSLIAKMGPNLKNIVLSKPVRNKFLDIALRAGKSWTTEEVTEILQETTTIIFC